MSLGPPGVLGILGEWLFIFRELGSTGNYFRGAREQANNLLYFTIIIYNYNLPKSKKKKIGKASILFDFLKISSAAC